MAVHEGFAFPHTIMRLELGGKDVTCNLQELLAERGVALPGPEGFAVANDIKEKLGEVALDYAQRAHALKQKPDEAPTYVLPPKKEQKKSRLAGAAIRFFFLPKIWREKALLVY